MAMPSTEVQLAAANREINDLKRELREKDCEFQELEFERNFHAIKAEELGEMLKTQKDDEMLNQLRIKTEQNADLTVQVQELRYHLIKMTGNVDTLSVELRQSADTVHRLSEERKSHQRMLIELSGVVRSIGNISLGYEKSDLQTTDGKLSEFSSLENIKRKVEAIEEDRQWHIHEKENLIKVIDRRDDEISGLEKELFSRTETLSQEKNQFIEENEALRDECASKARKIEALEHLFHNINKSQTEKRPPIPQDVICDTTHRSVAMEELETTEVRSLGDGNIEIVLKSGSSDDSTCSSLEPPEPENEEDVQKVTVASELLKDGHSRLKPNLKSAKKQISGLKKELKKSEKKQTLTKKKLDIREGLLRDVIHQYKELQKDHEESNARIKELEGRPENGFEDDQLPNQETGKSKKNQKMQTNEADPLEESPTFETETVCSVSSRLSDAATEAKTAHDEADGLNESIMDEYKRLEKENARLEHEYDDAIELINTLEDELTTVQEELQAAQETSEDLENNLDRVKLENDQLKEDNETALEKLGQLGGELESAQLQAEESQRKQKEREKDLWEVIGQYKKLSVENDETLSNLKGVERELYIAKKQATRKDLIYDYMKLQRDYEDATMRIKKMERELACAKKESARNKEESKGTRKRMAGCHHHYRQLQEQYNEALREKLAVEKQLNTAKKEADLRKKQEASWTEKLVHIRERRKESEEESKKLRQENNELKLYSDGLMLLCSKSLETYDI